MNQRIAIFISTLLIALPASADELSEKIKVGMSKVEVSHVMGEDPSHEKCTKTLGVSGCKLTYKKGFFTKTIYEVTTVADKVVSVAVQK
jgi:hypothetical protein